MSPSEKFSRELRERAVKTVIETPRPIAQVARELGLNPSTLGHWVRIWRRERTELLSVPGGLADSPMDPLSPAPGKLMESSGVDNFDLGEDEPSDRSGPVPVARVTRHRVPLSTIVTIVVNVFLYLIVANPFSAFLIGLATELAVVAVLSQSARESLHSSLGGLLLIVGLLIALDISGFLYNKGVANGKIGRMFYGKPFLGRLGGASQAMGRLALQMHKQFSMEVAPEDEKVVSAIRNLDRDILEAQLRAKYLCVRQMDGVLADQASREWTEKQWPRVLSRSYRGVTLGDTYSKSLVWQVFMYKVVLIVRVTMPLLSIGLALSIWLAARGIRAENYLPTLQVVALSGFLFAAIVFANVTYGFAFVQWQEPSKAVLSSLTDEGFKKHLVESVAPYVGKRLWPVKVTFGERYSRLVGNFFIRAAGPALSFYLASTLCILLICAMVGTIGSSGTDSEWYYHMAVALVAIPGIMFLSIYVAFLVLRMAGSLGAIVAAALILAVAPPMLTFLFTGERPGKGAVTSSIIAGVAGALATALADRTKERVQREKQ